MDELGRSQQWYEQELEKIRTDGDIALVRAQAERQHIAEADARLRTLQRQLKDKKRQFARLAGATAGGSIASDSAALEQANRRQEHARTQLEERLKVTNSARTAELHRLRGEIDDQRRRRLDALASEKSVIDETRRTEESIEQSQLEMETLKERAGLLRSEIAQLQSELDHEQNTFRLERQQLQLDLDRIARPEKVAVKVKVLGRVRSHL
jgi:chromosome segregation ATPase